MIKSYTEEEALQLIEDNENITIVYDNTELANNAFTLHRRYNGMLEFREGRQVAEQTKKWIDICNCEIKTFWKK